MPSSASTAPPVAPPRRPLGDRRAAHHAIRAAASRAHVTGPGSTAAPSLRLRSPTRRPHHPRHRLHRHGRSPTARRRLHRQVRHQGSRDPTGTLDRRLSFPAELAPLDITDHARRMIRTAWALGTRKDAHLRLRLGPHAWLPRPLLHQDPPLLHHPRGPPHRPSRLPPSPSRGPGCPVTRPTSLPTGPSPASASLPPKPGSPHPSNPPRERKENPPMASRRRAPAALVAEARILPVRYLTPEDLVEMFELPSVETVYQWRCKRTGPRGFALAGTCASTRPTCGPGWTTSGKGRLPDGRAHPGSLVQGRGRAGRQDPQGEDRALRIGDALPGPVHRAGRDREEQELPRSATAPRRDMARTDQGRHGTWAVRRSQGQPDHLPAVRGTLARRHGPIRTPASP